MSSILTPLRDWVRREPDHLLYAFLDIEGRVTERYTYAQFHARTGDVAAHIRGAARLAPGDRVLLMYPPGVEMICAFFACVRLGLIPVPVYPPAGAGFAAALEKVDFIARDAGAAAVLTTRGFYWSMRVHAARAAIARRSLARTGISTLPWIRSDEADIGAGADVPESHSSTLFLQYTSGSTRAPRGVVVTHANVLANGDAVVDHRPVGVSWLPQYHDMGLIGYYLFFALKGGTTYGFSPADFIRRPLLWLETITRVRGTASSAPNFAYEYCLRPDKVPDAALASLDLSSLRFLMTAAEPVRDATCRRFAERFERCGLDPAAFFAAYGLAEFTLAVTNYGRTARRLDRAALQRGSARPAPASAPERDVTTLVSCGRPLADTELRIVAPEEPHRVLAYGNVGEIWLRGASRCAGYWGQPALTAATFEARLAGEAESDARRWLRTGDLGFVHDGELYVCGRAKDMVIVRGLNYFPQDIEAVVEECHGVRRGGVAAFAHDDGGDEQLMVVAEVGDPRRPPAAHELERSLVQALGVGADTVVFIAPRSIPKTSSGKVARHRVRQRWMEGTLDVVATHSFARPGTGGPVDTASGVEGAAPSADGGRAWLQPFGLTGHESHTLAEAGFDSLRIVELAEALRARLEQAGSRDLGASVDLRVLPRIAICELAGLVDQVAAAAPHARLRLRRALTALGDEHRALEFEAMRRDARLREDVAALPLPAGGAPAGSGVLLTGATGFFGPFLLDALLRQQDDDVWVLARDGERAMARIRDGLAGVRGTGVAHPDWERRVRLVQGDLASRQLGLDDGTWRRLARDVHTIWHNGASVNYLLDYAAMRDANVGGTSEVVRLALTGHRKTLNHVSTTFIFGWSTQDTLGEEDINARMEGLDFGYSQSKWVAEQVVHEAARRGVPVRVFRPALLAPSLAGAGSSFDIGIRLLSFMLRRGITTTARNQVSFTPADLAATNMVGISRIPGSIGRTFHVTRDEHATMADVTAILGMLTGRAFRAYPLADFVPEVIQRCRPGDVLFPLLDFLVRSVDSIAAMEFKRYDNAAYRHFRDAAGGVADPPLEDVVRGMLRFMQRHRLVDAVAPSGASLVTDTASKAVGARR